MGCCSSSSGASDGRATEDEVAFDYCPNTGAIIPVRHTYSLPSDSPTKSQADADTVAMMTPQEGSFEGSMVMYTPQDRPPAALGSFTPASFATAQDDAISESMLRHQDQRTILTPAQEKYVNDGKDRRTRLLRLDELETLKRSEIYGAFLVTSKMLDLARKRVKPLYRFRGGVRHVDPLCSVPTVTVHVDGSAAAVEDMGDAAQAYTPHERPRTPSTNSPSAVVMGEVAERLQILDISGMNTADNHKTKCPAMGNKWDFLSQAGSGEHLSQGDAYFGFCCKPGSKLDDGDLTQLGTIVNLTGFEDELRDNHTPTLDVSNQQSIAKYTFIMVKAMYLIPGFELNNMTREVMASIDYQKGCQPGGPKFWDDCTEPYTFRFTKPLIKFVYSIVVQLRVHEITDPGLLMSFRSIDGLIPEKAVLLERTKRDPTKQDSTLKCKSVLLYYRVTGGTLVTNVTTVVNSAIPTVVAKLVNNFGSSGAAEVAETATMTRAYLRKVFGDARR